MTDVEIAEHALATLHDKLHAATRRANEIAIDRQRLGYLAFVDNDPAARADLNVLNQQMATLADETDAIKAGLVHAQARLADARKLEADADATERRTLVRALLVELEASAPALDRTGVHPETGRVYRLNDPPARVKVAALVGGLMVELRALGLTDVSFSAFRWDVMAWQDLRRALLDTMQAAWPAPAQRVTARERDSFTALLAAFARIIRSNLGEQTTERADAA